MIFILVILVASGYAFFFLCLAIGGLEAYLNDKEQNIKNHYRKEDREFEKRSAKSAKKSFQFIWITTILLFLILWYCIGRQLI